MKAQRRSRGTAAPSVLNLGTSCRWVVNISPYRFTPEKEPWNPLNRRQSGLLGGDISLALWIIQPAG